MSRAELAKSADQIIGAAQALEQVARNLKACAKAMRQYGVSVDYELWMMHRAYDVRHAAAKALAELGEVA